MKRVLGVDPGAYGALALLERGALSCVHDMPIFTVQRGKTNKAEVDGYRLGTLLRDLDPDLVVVELVGGMTGQSPSAAFNFGRAAGAAEYCAKALRYSVTLVPAATWKRSFRLRGGKEGKDDSRALACSLWPARAEWFARKKDDGRAEAALIAAWGARNSLIGGREEDVFG